MRSFCSRFAPAFVAGLFLSTFGTAHAVTATVTDLGGQPVGISTLKLDGVPVTPTADGSYELPSGTHEMVVTSTVGGSYISQVTIPDGSQRGRVILEPGFGGIGKVSFAAGSGFSAPPTGGMAPREATPDDGMAPREASHWVVTPQLNFEEWTLPRAASGVYVVGSGQDRPIRLSPEHVNGVGGGLRLTHRGFWPGVDKHLDFGFFNNDASHYEVVAPGYAPVGFLYPRRAPNGSTGLGLGSTGADVRTDVDITRYKLGVTLWDPDYSDGQGLIGGLDAGGSFGGSFGSFGSFGGPKLAGGVTAFWQRFDTDQRSWVNSPTFSTINSRFKQDLTEDQFGLGGQMKLTVPLSRSASMFAEAGLAGIYRRADLDSTQWNRCGLCAAPENSFTAETDDRDNGFTWAGSAGLGLEWNLAPEFSVGLAGRYLYYRDTGAIKNPVQGDSALYRETYLDDQRAFGWQASLGANIRF